jgi:hypothetical protein
LRPFACGFRSRYLALVAESFEAYKRWFLRILLAAEKAGWQAGKTMDIEAEKDGMNTALV